MVDEQRTPSAAQVPPTTLAIEESVRLIAQGEAPRAVDLLRRAAAQWPDHGEVHEALGDALLAARRDEEALGSFLTAIRLNPKSGDACVKIAQTYFSRGLDDPGVHWIRQAMQIDEDPTRHAGVLAAAEARRGHRDAAVRLCRQWVAAAPDSPERRHLAAAITGDSPPEKAAPSYVKRLFDGYSEHFDASLERLDYCGPRLAVEALAPWPTQPDWRALDLGCGTGLVGVLLRPHCAHLTGIDLSPKMLAVSAGREVYDQLLEADVIAYLGDHPGEFDAIAGSDVLTYIGDLSEFFPAAAAALRPGGRTAMVLEEAPHNPRLPGYRLNPTGRYAHQAAYIEQGFAQAGLSVQISREHSMRQECGRPTPTLTVRAERVECSPP